MSETTDLLAKVPLLSSLDQKQLERLARDFSERTFPAGSVVVREGDTHGMGFFVVADGEGTVTVGGKEVGKISRGSYFGEVALISDRFWERRFGPSRAKRLLAAFAGGVLTLYGARLAGGCTSGHGISGALQLAVSSWVFIILAFAVGAITAFVMYGKEGPSHV